MSHRLPVRKKLLCPTTLFGRYPRREAKHFTLHVHTKFILTSITKQSPLAWFMGRVIESQVNITRSLAIRRTGWRKPDFLVYPLEPRPIRWLRPGRPDRVRHGRFAVSALFGERNLWSERNTEETRSGTTSFRDLLRDFRGISSIKPECHARDERSTRDRRHSGSVTILAVFVSVKRDTERWSKRNV